MLLNRHEVDYRVTMKEIIEEYPFVKKQKDAFIKVEEKRLANSKGFQELMR
jgi:hypothetical protein